MKRITFTLVASAIALFASAQQPATDKCATTQVTKAELSKNPALALQHAQFLYDLQNYLAANPQLKQAKADGPRVIPVVFHVIYDGNLANISKDQILDQLDIMNEDFRRLNADAANTPEAFDSVAADCNIEFRLANLDPEGKCTDGITRTFSPRTTTASNQNGVKAVKYWNRDKYLNVWVVNTIGDLSTIGGTVLGYAQFPLGGLTSTDGIVIRSDYIGSIGTATGRKGRTVTHEIGHWLGLRHIWGDEDCGTDFVFDTPVHKEANFGCFNYPKYNTCADGDTIRGEMFMNYMDYSDDYCMNMFSKGQKAIMDFTLDGPPNGSILGFRENLWSQDNLIATGVTNNPAVPCAPIADMFSNRRMICQGQTVSFTDNSYNGSVSSRSWTFEGGNGSGTSTAANPTVTYTTPGIYDVSLTVTNAQGTSDKTLDNYIIVSSNTADDNNYGYFESFENEDWFNNKWIVFNDDNEVFKWNRIIGAASDMFHSAYINNYGNFQGAVEELITPSYDLTSVSNPTLSFRYSGATRDTSLNDQLRVYISTNCGQTWSLRTSMNGPELANAGLFSGPYLPPNVNIWTEKKITIPSNVVNNDNVRFKFEFTSGGNGSNNFYIDQINISNLTSVDEISDVVGLTVFPNPLSDADIATVKFHLAKQGMVSVDVIDMLGRKVADVYSGQMNAGSQTLNINRNTFAADGVYFVRFNVGNQQTVKKLIVAKQ